VPATLDPAWLADTVRGLELLLREWLHE
jgi:hypothetical protein